MKPATESSAPRRAHSANAADAAAWHTLSGVESLERQFSQLDGLDQMEAADRLNRLGPNVLHESKQVRPWRILVAQFQSVLVGLLVVAGLVSGLLGEWTDAIAILAIVVLNGFIGFYQEFNAERSLAALKRMTSPHAKVRRGGIVSSVPASDVVSGDVVLLEAGDVVPADMRLLEAAALRCTEAALTGESEPVDKQTEPLGRVDLPLGDRSNVTFMGTNVAAGTGLGVVVATGMTTEIGRIAHLLAGAAAQTEETPLQRRLQSFGRVLVLASVGIVLLLFLLGLARGLELTEMFLTAISLAVAAVPEGLPAVVTVALALGVMRMSRRRALIRRLPAVETLGCADVICSDKTGTLTVGEMTVRTLLAAGSQYEVTGEGYAPDGEIRTTDGPLQGQPPEALRRLLATLVGCNDAHIVQEEGSWKAVGDPTEAAMLSAGAKLGILREDMERDLLRAREWPFDSDRKRMSVARRLSGGGLEVLAKGAPDVLIERCTQILTADGVRDLTDEDRRSIEDAQSAFAGRALRVLAAAYRTLDPEELEQDEPDEIERDLIFVGLVGMYDPPRAEARVAVESCRGAGVRVVMITGDHPRTAIAIARELSIAGEEDRVLSGPELDRLSDGDLKDEVSRTAVYARVTAEHKLRIVRAWQAGGAVVAMTGDGVNDAPAIKGADIGIAMGRTGTEVTKEASDMVVTDDNFASIVAAVEEGRGVYDNIKKTLQYLLAGNTGELLLMTACIVVGLPVPLLPIHLLWINLVTDGLPALCLAVDPIDPDVMKRPPRRKGQGLADRHFLSNMLFTGVLTAGASLGVYLYALRTGSEELARTQAFAALVFAELLRAFSVRSATKPIWRIGLLSNVKLALVVAVSFGFQVATHHVDALRSFLKTSFMPWSDCFVLVAVGCMPLLILEAVKLLRRPSTPQVVRA